MDLNLLPSPAALKNMIVAYDVYTSLGGLILDEDAYESEWYLEYDKKKEEYTLWQEQNADEHYLSFTWNKKFCYLLGNNPETGRRLPDEALAAIPEEISKAAGEAILANVTFLIWSTDGIHWNQLEAHEEDHPMGTLLGTFLDEGNFANPDDGRFQARFPVIYQLYRQVPFNNEMLLELEGTWPESDTVTKLKLPKLNIKKTVKILQRLNYPAAFSEDYQLIPSPETTGRLIEKKFYFLSAFCLGKLLAESPKDKELLRKTGDICYAAEQYVAAMNYYKKAGINDPRLYLHVAGQYLAGKDFARAAKYYLLGLQAQQAGYADYLEIAEKMSQTGWRGAESAIPLYEEIHRLEPDCHEANFSLFKHWMEKGEENKKDDYIIDDEDDDDLAEEEDINAEDDEISRHILSHFDQCDPARLEQCHYARLAKYLLKKRQFEKAYTYIIKGQQLADNTYFTTLLADCLMHLNRYEEAIGLYESVECRNVLAYYWGNEYNQWETIQNYRREREELKQIVRNGDDPAEAYKKLGAHYETLGAYHTAQHYYDKAAILNRSYRRKVYYELEDDDEKFEKALQTREGCIDLFHHYVNHDYYADFLSWEEILEGIEEIKKKFPDERVSLNLQLIRYMVSSICPVKKDVLDALIKETAEAGYDGIFEVSMRYYTKMLQHLVDGGYNKLALKNIDYYENCGLLHSEQKKNLQKMRSTILNQDKN